MRIRGQALVDTELAIDIPSFPTAVGQLVTEINSDNPAINRIVQLIECEPSLAAKLIASANSPIYGARRQIRTVRHAVVILGFRAVSSMVFSIAASDLLGSVDPKLAEFSSRILSDSLATAVVGRVLSAKSKWVEPDEAFLVGVMHEIGKLVLMQSVKNVNAEALLKASPEEEMELYGHNHLEVGRLCIEHWKLDPGFGQAIANHHCEFDEAPDNLSKTLVLSQSLAHVWNLEKEVKPDGAAEVEREVAEKLETDVADMRERCREQFEVVRDICT